MILFKNNFCQIEEFFWNDVKQQVKEKNPGFFDLIDKINPSSQYAFIKARYSYGTKIIENGVLKLPVSNKKSIDLHNNDCPVELKEKLGYCSIPLAFILHNTNEVFIERSKHVIPLNYFLPGNFFGVFETVDFFRGRKSHPTWTVTAGARSVFMLPKITDTNSYKRIKKKYNLFSDLPITLMDQFNSYAEIVNNIGGTESWFNEVIFFTKNWFIKDDKQKGIHWSNFYQYLFDLCLFQLDYFRINTELDSLWQPFTKVLSERGIKPRPYLIDTVKHLISIASGIAVGFRPVIDNTAMPLDILEKVFVKDYLLKEYAPVFIQPHKLLSKISKPIYYSLSLPTLGYSSPFTRNPINIIEDQRDIRRLIDTLKYVIDNMTVQECESRITEILQCTNFEYFHCVPDTNSSIISSEEIPKTDKDFDPKLNNRHLKGRFCSNASFMRGIIKIHRE